MNKFRCKERIYIILQLIGYNNGNNMPKIIQYDKYKYANRINCTISAHKHINLIFFIIIVYNL